MIKQKFNAPLVFFIIVLLFLITINLSYYARTDSKEDSLKEVCKNNTPFSLYWEERNIDYNTFNWHYFDEDIFYARFDLIYFSNKPQNKITFIEIYNLSKGVSEEYYINDTSCIKDINNATEPKFNILEYGGCIKSNKVIQNISTSFSRIIFDLPKNCSLRK